MLTHKQLQNLKLHCAIFKITKKDIILGIGFIFCCVAVGFMAYVINTSVNGGM